jgi:hypothetical protein
VPQPRGKITGKKHRGRKARTNNKKNTRRLRLRQTELILDMNKEGRKYSAHKHTQEYDHRQKTNKTRTVGDFH